MNDPMPPAVLLGVKSHLSLVDKRLARCVSREWAAELATAVRTVQLPPELWQVPGPHQAAALARLATTFWSFRACRLLADSQRDADPAAVDTAVAMLRGIGALQVVSVCRLGGSSSGWAALLGGLAGLGSRVTSLELRDVRLPGPAGLDALGGLANIRSLVLHSNSSARLQQQHVDALSRMAGLTSLQLSFRATAGTLAVPVTLDALGRMGSLAQLDVRYVGMPELATGVCFADEFILQGCTSLQRLMLSRVPTPSLRGLFRLPQLQHLSLAQLAPLAESQARSLSLCTQLQQLSIDNMPLELLPQLVPLVRLMTLSVRLWAPPAAGGQEMPGGLNVLALAALANLQSLQLTGPVMVSKEDVAALAAGLSRLCSLSLAVTLLDGCAGFGSFQVLRQLKVAAWTCDCSRRTGQAGLGGFDEAPLDGRQGVLVAPGDLPCGLQTLEGWELHFTAPSALQQQEAGSGAAPVLRSLKLHHSPDSELAGRLLVLPAPNQLAALATLDLQHPQLTAAQLDAVVSACSRSLTSLSINAASFGSQLCKPLRPAAPQGAASAPVPGVSRSASEGGPAGKGGASSSSSNRSNRSSSSGGVGSSSSGGYFAAAAAAVAAAAAAGATFGSSMAAATAAATAGAATAGALSRSRSLSNNGSFSSSRQGVLEGLGLPTMSLQSMGSASLAALLGDALLVGSQGGAGAAGGGSGALSAMAGGLCQGLGLACLARCGQLAELSLVLGDRALGPKARAAIAALPGLRQLRLAVAADSPAAAARELGPWLAGLRRLELLSLALEGPEAGDALEALAAGVAAALPACQVVVLKPAMMG